MADAARINFVSGNISVGVSILQVPRLARVSPNQTWWVERKNFSIRSDIGPPTLEAS